MSRLWPIIFCTKWTRGWICEKNALNALEDYGWPGNVRELRNAITRAAVLAESCEICAADLKPSAQGPAARPELKRPLGGLEEQVIRETLEKSGGRQDVAAGLLGISRRTLLRRLKEYRTRANTSVCASPALSISRSRRSCTS